MPAQLCSTRACMHQHTMHLREHMRTSEHGTGLWQASTGAVYVQANRKRCMRAGPTCIPFRRSDRAMRPCKEARQRATSGPGHSLWCAWQQLGSPSPLSSHIWNACQGSSFERSGKVGAKKNRQPCHAPLLSSGAVQGRALRVKEDPVQTHPSLPTHPSLHHPHLVRKKLRGKGGHGPTRKAHLLTMNGHAHKHHEK